MQYSINCNIMQYSINCNIIFLAVYLLQKRTFVEITNFVDFVSLLTCHFRKAKWKEADRAKESFKERFTAHEIRVS